MAGQKTEPTFASSETFSRRKNIVQISSYDAAGARGMGGLSGWAALPARALDRIDGRSRAQRRDDVAQVFHAADLDVEGHFEEFLGAIHDLEIRDIAEVAGDHGGQRAQASGLVGDDEVDASDMDVLVLLDVPGQIDPAF